MTLPWLASCFAGLTCRQERSSRRIGASPWSAPLACRRASAVGDEESGGMRGACFPVEALRLHEGLDGQTDLPGRQENLARDRRPDSSGFLQAFDAAQAAAGGADETPLSFLQQAT